MEKQGILIFGDSYSTFEGYIPKEYATYYPNEICGVKDVKQTWWDLLSKEISVKIIANDSWSGSTVCNTGYNHCDCSKTSSFICRLEVLIREGFFQKNTPDKVFVFGGTNDSWTGNACGEIKYGNWTEEDLRLILPGYAYFIHRLLSVVPKEKVCAIANSDLRAEVTEGIIDICAHYGVPCVRLVEIEKINGHPTPKGMQAIKNQVLDAISKQR